VRRKSAVRFVERLANFLQDCEAEGVVKKDDMDCLEVHIPRTNQELSLAEPFIGYVLNDETKEIFECEVVEEESDDIMLLRYHSGEVRKGEIFYYFLIDPDEDEKDKEKDGKSEVKTQAN